MTPLVPSESKIANKSGAKKSLFRRSNQELFFNAQAGLPLLVEAYGAIGKKVLLEKWVSAPNQITVFKNTLPRGMVWLRVVANGQNVQPFVPECSCEITSY